MLSKLQLYIYLTVLAALLLGSYFFYKYAYKKGYEERRDQEQVVTITDFDTASVIQQARLNWLPKSIVDSLLKGKSIVKIRWEDKLNIRDSVNIIDSLVKYPIYESDTNFTLRTVDEFAGEVSVDVSLYQKFLLYQEMFASNLVINSIKIQKDSGTITEVEYLPYRFSVMGGIKNRFDKEVIIYTGLEYNILDYRYFQMYLSGEGNYILSSKLWEAESRAGVRLKF